MAKEETIDQSACFLPERRLAGGGDGGAVPRRAAGRRGPGLLLPLQRLLNHALLRRSGDLERL